MQQAVCTAFAAALVAFLPPEKAQLKISSRNYFTMLLPFSVGPRARQIACFVFIASLLVPMKQTLLATLCHALQVNTRNEDSK